MSSSHCSCSVGSFEPKHLANRNWINWDADLEQTWTCCSGASSEKPATDLANVTIVLTKWVIRAVRSDWLNSESLPWNQKVWPHCGLVLSEKRDSIRKAIVVSMTENLSIPNYFYQYLIALAGLKRVLKRSLWTLSYAHRFTWSDQTLRWCLTCSPDIAVTKPFLKHLVAVWCRGPEVKRKRVDTSG